MDYYESGQEANDEGATPIVVNGNGIENRKIPVGDNQGNAIPIGKKETTKVLKD